MAEAPKERIWDYVVSQVTGRFGLDRVARSPSLQAIIGEGVRYVKVEDRGIWFDTRALTLGLLVAGAPNGGELRSFAARSFREWVESQVTKAVLSRTLVAEATPVEPAERFLGQEASIHVSTAVKGLIKRSGELSQATIKTPLFDGRHLFAAMVEKGSIADQMRRLFGKAVSEDEVAELLSSFIEGVSGFPEKSGTRESWQAALALPPVGPSPPPPAPPPAPPGEEIFRFSHDGVRGGDNVLEIKRDVDALAKLICLQNSTPLAVAIFGGWGSGKSTFMEALDSKVTQIAGDAAECVNKGMESPFVSRVVQVQFNAWQFVDANLWASLTAEFFDQLRAGGWRRAGSARHAWLVERVNNHVHSLTSEAKARRAEVIAINRQVIEAKEERDEAARWVRQTQSRAIGQAALDTLGEIYEAQRGNLAALGIAIGGEDPSRGVDAMVEALRSSRSIFAQAKTIVQIVCKYRTAPLLAGLLLLLVAGGWLLWFRGLEEADLAAAAAAVVAAGTLVRSVLPALSLVVSVGRRGAGIARRLDAADDKSVRALLTKEALLRNATVQADAAAGSADRADRALARYVDPTGPSNPPRLLRYVLEDDPETKAFEKEIGLIGRARRLFQAVDHIIGENDADTPQRIVIYIDDLDRCTEKQVYDVLQAIHLLLAFKSFAVVVGVDVRWIEGALAAKFANRSPLSEIDRRQHAVRYLEKIFQVALWLDPLTKSKDGGSFAAFVTALTKPEERRKDDSERDSHDEPARTDPPATITGPAKGPAAVASHGWGWVWRYLRPHRRGGRPGSSAGPEESLERPTAEADGDGQSADSSPESASEPGTKAAETERAREAVRTVEIEPAEALFLASDAVAGLAGSTPRSVKRLVNAYRLVRSRLADDGAELLGTGIAPAVYPLIALTTAIETGQPVEVAASFLKALEGTAGPDGIIVIEEGAPAGEASLSTAFEMMLAHQLRMHGASGGVDQDDDLIVRDKCPGLVEALTRVHELRRGSVAASDVLRVAKLARRFSFNRHQ
jgi:hypothetical protein